MKKIVWGLCFMGVAAPASAAFWQQAKEDTEAKPESPVKVNVQGADDALAENLRALMPSLRNLKCDSPSDRVARFIESSGEKLQEAAQAMGYYDAQFNVTPTRQGNCLALNVAVQPGEPVKVTQVQVQVTGEGKNLDEFRELAATPPYQPGEPLVQQKYKDFKSSLNRAANNLGFFDAGYITRKIQVDPDTRQAQIKLHFDTGKRYRVGKVDVAQDVLDTEHLNRYLRLKEGDTYDVANVLKQQRVLEGSGYYSDVQVHSNHKQATDGVVPVEIEARRGKRYSYMGQLGYGTDTGFRAETDMNIHWVNSKGHQVNAKGKVAQKEQLAEVIYKVPLWHPENEYSRLSVAYKKSENNGIKSKFSKVGVDYNRRSDSDWQQTVFINYLDETNQVTGAPEIRAQFTLLGARVTKSKSDDMLFPSKGWSLSAEVQGARKSVLSDENVIQGKVQGKYLQTFDNHGKLILQGAAGTALTNNLNGIPKSLRFFAGGPDSVRGYDVESLGEKNAAGAVIGGKHLLTTSVEYEHPLVDKWSAAAFVDAGNAFDSTAKLTMKVGSGVGVRWKSPLGPVRADIAVPKDNARDVHFYFSLGPDL
ncbi:MAG: autotransporter assembly complex protein TamA [Thiothrix sp.]|uniref:autotransporter assembly complex protein TamA n=1 Tax=Thiothrix sp. TaxID=1032 RepID=UPI00263912CC|nr:autotransporter assembly complex family protein [Thiothrix sp.]MDD5393393.1 autotransporter assembly complex protein TamA [Thiothrix sp.]